MFAIGAMYTCTNKQTNKQTRSIKIHPFGAILYPIRWPKEKYNYSPYRQLQFTLRDCSPVLSSVLKHLELNNEQNSSRIHFDIQKRNTIFNKRNSNRQNGLIIWKQS